MEFTLKCIFTLISPLQFLESEFTLGDEECHSTKLEGESGSEALKLYGINRDSILNKLAYFHVCSGALLPDVMHDALERGTSMRLSLC